MDISSYLRCFEDSLASYSGDDPLHPWDRFVDFLEQMGAGSEMLPVFDAIVQRFLNVDRYANDIRYVNYCIKCASHYPDPAALYGHVFSKGVGSRTAALYVAWAQQLEKKGMNQQADGVYQKAVENQAQPADLLLHEYSQFQSRTRTQPPPPGAPLPLQNSQQTNQIQASHQRQGQNKAPAVSPSQPAARRTIVTVSRSEVPRTLPSSAAVPTSSAYDKDTLVCDGSEFCFEEVRAAKYFLKVRQQREKEQREQREKEQREKEQRESMERRLQEEEEEAAQRLNPALDRVNQDLEARLGLPSWFVAQQAQSSAAARPPPSEPGGRRPLVLGADPGPCSAQQLHSGEPGALCLSSSLVPEPEDKLDGSCGGAANLSHITPNSSLGYVQATPTRVLPSPTVNTQEALDAIMDMFQAPTLLDGPFQEASMLHGAAETHLEPCAVSSVPNPPAHASTPFTIFQDEEDASAAAPPEKSKPVNVLVDLGAPKADRPNETPSELVPDESTTWGARYNSLRQLDACPNSTSDFALLAQCVSTPFTHKSLFSSSFQTQENSGSAEENFYLRRQTKKLSPIIEQSPSADPADAKPLPPSSSRQGTIMADGSASSSLSIMQPPAVLSFRDQTSCPAQSDGSGWEVYPSPERRPEPASQSRSFKILEDPEPVSPEPVRNRPFDVPMSPESAPSAAWLDIRSPEPAAEPDLDAFLSPRPPVPAEPRTRDVPMSPEPPTSAQVRPVSDPWDSELILDLLGGLNPPLTSHPRCISWPCRVPAIGPKMTLSVGNSSLRVDGVLGKGAFATVYQATDPRTSEKVVLKVQKPSNPWEFYINSCLDARLQPAVRHLFSRIHSAHLFQDGSMMLGELHQYGTLLNAVNIYRTMSEKVMPQPLVLYFSVCILHTVEKLHAAGIIHADIKPDNFMLGKRFLDSSCFDADGVDHGLVLIDLGQSIDMQLFPEGTAFTARCLTSGFQCTEMLSGKPWTYQTDYFGVAGTVYCMLFGSYMQVSHDGGVWKTNAVFRRNPHSDLWLDFFHTLLNVADCAPLPSLRALRCRMASALQQNYGSKLQMLKNRLVVKLLEEARR
ncbi:PREDICTED: mitotic checkpoint serine/threonine-protein kinase BUB1-like [Cyprinodon variegatus]|uniref:mitotic checkpoint serine/threonine-protein kinase BUB1-like n=1 Tax=Cyprinodon variegatus TaxID=28743 RepID=UPI000742C6F4|nr:PREDICTED: mitotic checkpoint serine/threonine-protein kinase BUB1-like [Cyprinodon variegatus]